MAATAKRSVFPDVSVGRWLVVALPLAASLFLIANGVPRWALMWLLAISIYAFCKWLTLAGSNSLKVPRFRKALYLLAWPGLNAGAFLQSQSEANIERPRLGEWLFAAVKLLLGICLLWWVAPKTPANQPLVLGWVGMIGMIFVLHFGLFHLLSCLMRSNGIAAPPLMRWPIVATSLSDFWGRRWNRAFRDFAHRFVFRPLTARYGAKHGLAAGFLFSGVVHDVVISVPAGGGYGLPTLYFAIQAAGLLFERSTLGVGFGLNRRFTGWIFTMLVLLVPLGLLFHPPFVRQIVLPFMSVIGVT